MDLLIDIIIFLLVGKVGNPVGKVIRKGAAPARSADICLTLLILFSPIDLF